MKVELGTMHKEPENMHLFALLSGTAREYPRAEAFISSAERCTYAQLHACALTLAAQLLRAGIRPGMRVALVCAGDLPCVYTVFALLRLGAVCIPLNRRLTPRELGAQLEHCDASFLLHDEPSREILPAQPCIPRFFVNEMLHQPDTLTALPPPPRGADPACIIYTAGTSSSPRGVVLSHAGLLANSAGYRAACGFAPGQRELATTQLYHISTFSRLFTYVRSAVTCVLMDRFDPEACFAVMRRENITSITQTPTMYRMLQQTSASLNSAGERLARVITGASAMSPAERQALRELFPAADLYDIYGQTEAGPGISVLGPRDFFRKSESVGKPMPGVSVAVVDEHGRALPAGTVGEITCRGRNLMQGYFRDPEATQAVLADGRLYTGDMGYMDEEGFLYITGRKKDIIITGGINVYPFEIENVLRACPGIDDCAVFGVPDCLWGEAVVAAVVLRETTVTAVHEHCRHYLAGFKCPREIVAVPELPRNAAMKIQRGELLLLWNSLVR